MSKKPNFSIEIFDILHVYIPVYYPILFHWLDYSDNSIDRNQNKVKYTEEKKKKLELKTMSKDLKMDYDKLEAMALSSSVEDKSFQDPRVYELWALAKKAKMPPEELESLKVRCSLNYCLIFCNKVINLIEKVGISPSFLSIRKNCSTLSTGCRSTTTTQTGWGSQRRQCRGTIKMEKFLTNIHSWSRWPGTMEERSDTDHFIYVTWYPGVLVSRCIGSQ